MAKKQIAAGAVHDVPKDLKEALAADATALAAWEDITGLARNEWICWVITAKKEETRLDHIRRTVSELKEGMRRPCCWIGCIHRKDRPLSLSLKAILNKRRKK